jgi:hypothetical protein
MSDTGSEANVGAAAAFVLASFGLPPSDSNVDLRGERLAGTMHGIRA